MYAALWRAVAAAALRKACDFASASFFAQSGRTLSVVMTVGADADREVVRLLHEVLLDWWMMIPEMQQSWELDYSLGPSTRGLCGTTEAGS